MSFRRYVAARFGRGERLDARPQLALALAQRARRTGVEERALERRFGDAYRNYRSNTPRRLGVPAH